MAPSSRLFDSEGPPQSSGGLIFLGVIMMILMMASIVLMSPGFREIRYTEAMDMAQIARNRAQGHGMVTSVVRPLQLRQFASDAESFPDLSNPPLFPLVLSTVFKAAEPNDKTVAATSSIFLAILLVLILLWGTRVIGFWGALLASALLILNASFVFTVSSGLPIALASGFLFPAILLLSQSEKVPTTKALVAGALAGLAFLSQYGAIACAAGCILYLFVRLKFRAGTSAVSFFLIGFLVPCLPWFLRNMMLTGKPMGSLRFLDALMFTASHPGLQLLREVSTEPIGLFQFMFTHVIEFTSKCLWQILGLTKDLPNQWGWVILVLFFATFERRRLAPVVQRLRDLVAFCLGSYVLLACPFTTSSQGLLLLLSPAVLVGTALLLMSHSSSGGEEDPGRSGGTRKRWRPLALAAATCVISALPLINQTIGGPVPEPKLIQGDLDLLKDKLPEDAMVVTDVPFATAWRTGRLSIWLPVEFDQLRALCESRKDITHLFLSPCILDYPATEKADPWKMAFMRQSAIPGFVRQMDFSGFGALYKRTEMEEVSEPIAPSP